MSLVTAGTDCTVSQHLWDVAVNCSKAWISNCLKLSPKVLWVCVTMHVWLSWSVVVAHERRRQDDSHQLSMTQNVGMYQDFGLGASRSGQHPTFSGKSGYSKRIFGRISGPGIFQHSYSACKLFQLKVKKLVLASDCLSDLMVWCTLSLSGLV